ncbi:MAG: hypothetical protein KGL39_17915 [Patescibacteria group bacterium]|nr:hypothetical protein [Patescibacteria group bacterium]
MKFKDRLVRDGEIFNAKENGDCMKEVAHRYGMSLANAYKAHKRHETILNVLGIPAQKNVKHPELTM